MEITSRRKANRGSGHSEELFLLREAESSHDHGPHALLWRAPSHDDYRAESAETQMQPDFRGLTSQIDLAAIAKVGDTAFRALLAQRLFTYIEHFIMATITPEPV